jgi:flagellar basal-body rod modification protein FlgD
MADTISAIGTVHTSLNYADRVPVQKLDQDDFIKILVAQLTSQDPMNPQKDTEFVGQMAQFSSLESTKSMQTEIKTLRANSMIGKTVEVAVNRDANVVGEVTAVVHEKGEPKIVIGDRSYSLADVVRVDASVEPVNPPATSPTSNQ